MMHQRQGVTLIELVVVLAILGIMAGVVGLSMHTATPAPAPAPAHSTTVAQITRLRDSALASGHSISTVLVTHDTAAAITAYPDGRVLTTIGHIERMTGRVRADH